MSIKTELFIDKRKNSQLFDDLSSFFEKHDFEKEPYFKGGFDSLLDIEKHIQDLDETASSEENDIQIFAITVSLNQLRLWRQILGRTEDRTVFKRFVKYLNTLVNILSAVKHGSSKLSSFYEVKELFGEFFYTFKDIADSCGLEVSIESIMDDILDSDEEAMEIPVYQNRSSDYNSDSLFEWDIYLWINTKDAFKVNKFINLISSVLSYIDEVDIEIVDSGIGSFYQRWKIKIKSFFAKKRTKEILEKGVKAAEYYSLDRHIEPIEKSKTERKKVEEEIKRMMSEEQIQELHKLMIEEKRQDVKAKKLANFEKELELNQKLSDLLAKGLVQIDDDYNIEINHKLLISQNQKAITIGEVNDTNVSSNENK